MALVITDRIERAYTARSEQIQHDCRVFLASKIATTIFASAFLVMPLIFSSPTWTWIPAIAGFGMTLLFLNNVRRDFINTLTNKYQ